jgi:hypothetical protein
MRVEGHERVNAPIRRHLEMMAPMKKANQWAKGTCGLQGDSAISVNATRPQYVWQFSKL